MKLRAVAIVFFTAGLASTADSPAVALLRQVAAKIHTNNDGLPNYTCVQNILRMQFSNRFASRGQCKELPMGRRKDVDRGIRMFQDRLRLDVAVVDNREMFAWAGAKSFETSEISSLIGGTSGSGDFGSFLVAAFSKDVTKYTYKGEEDTDIGKLAKYLYDVPFERSRYRTRIGNDYVTVAYNGTFYADPQEADIRRLVIEADEFPQIAGVCRVVDTMDYRRVKMGDHDFLLPELTTMEVLYTSGNTSLNETRYTGCKQYVGESTIRFDDVEEQKITAEEKKEAQIPLPLKVKVPITLASTVDLYRASAGDVIQGIVAKDVLKDKKVLLKANSKIHGRLVQVEQDFPPPFPHWIIGISWETVERAGQEQPIRLEPVDDGFRSRVPQSSGRMKEAIAGLPRHKKNAGVGMFIFATSENPRLDPTFHSEWLVSAPPAPAAASPAGSPAQHP